jgi:hypothetical protein
MKTREDVANLLEEIIRDTQYEKAYETVKKEINFLRDAGQKEYAHDEMNALANFERTGNDVGLDRKLVLWVFCMKHRDGVASFLKGHKSQREDVRGRINDIIVYLILLRAMIDDEQF